MTLSLFDGALKWLGQKQSCTALGNISVLVRWIFRWLDQSNAVSFLCYGVPGRMTQLWSGGYLHDLIKVTLYCFSATQGQMQCEMVGVYPAALFFEVNRDTCDVLVKRSPALDPAGTTTYYVSLILFLYLLRFLASLVLTLFNTGIYLGEEAATRWNAEGVKFRSRPCSVFSYLRKSQNYCINSEGS